MITFIRDPGDPRIALYRGIRERDLLGRQNLFVVEGVIALERAIRAGRYPIQSLLLLESRLAPMQALLKRLADEVPVMVADQSVIDAVAGFHLHRGVLALARREAALSVEELLAGLPRGSALLLGLVGISNHDNVGACFRNASAFCAQGVLLDQESCDPLYRKSIRVSSGAALVLPFAQGGSGEDMLAALDRHGFETWALSPTGGEPLFETQPPQRLALLLGAEGPGLPESLMARARRITIPMAEGFDSLNVATAGAVALAHAFSRKQSA